MVVATRSRARNAHDVSSATTTITTTTAAAQGGLETGVKARLKQKYPVVVAHHDKPMLLVEREKAPHFAKRKNIHGNYRSETPAIVPVLWSLFALHNETLNVWTHLLSFLLMVYLSFLNVVGTLDHIDTWGDVMAMVVYFACTCACFFFSATYHLFNCHSHTVYKRVMQADYIGIFLNIYGSFISGLHYSFHCEPVARTVYQVGITILCMMGCLSTFFPWFDDRKYFRYKVGFYMIVCAFAAAPLYHGYVVYGLAMTVRWWVLLFLYLFATFFYVTEFPESVFPHRFEVLGSSHQLFHTVVAVAAIWHYYTIMHYYGLRLYPGCEVLLSGTCDMY